MKLSLSLVAALVATISATPIRIITLIGAPSDNLYAFDSPSIPAKDIHIEHPHGAHHRPCNKAKGSLVPAPLGALLSRLGLASPQEHRPFYHPATSEDGPSVPAWYVSVEEMMHDVEGKIVPLMEGGVVRILPVMNEAGEPDKDVTRKHHEHMWESLEGKDGVKNHHHHHHGFHRSHSFGGRLHRALLDLTPAEFITMAFVLGTGIGSILHFIFMICLISIRYFRCDGKTRAERRAACKARRATRREERNVKREGRVRLDGEEGGEVVGEELPSYEDGEGVKLDEKA